MLAIFGNKRASGDVLATASHVFRKETYLIHAPGSPHKAQLKRANPMRTRVESNQVQFDGKRFAKHSERAEWLLEDL